MQITIDYAPVAKLRRGSTLAIQTALRTLKANPRDAAGNPGSFTLEKKYRGSVRIAADDVGVDVVTRTLADGKIQVFLKGNDPEEATAPLPGVIEPSGEEGGAKS